MKKAKNDAKKKINSDPSTLEGISAQNPHEDFVKKDANFKKSRGAQR